MAASSLDALRETHTIHLQWRAFELRPKGTPPLSEAYKARIVAHRPQMEQIARERFGLELKGSELKDPGATRLAHMGAKYADLHGQGEAYHKAVFRAHWQEERDIASPDVLVEIAQSLGLEAQEFRAALADDDYAYEVETDEMWAHQNELTGVPAAIFGNRYLVSGAQPVELFRQVADKCLAEGRIEEDA